MTLTPFLSTTEPATPTTLDLDRIAGALPDIAEAAGRVILEIYAGDFAVREKADRSPVSDADEQAEALILDRLAALTPGIPVVAEERAAAGDLPETAGGPFFLVDPLDGTREFVQRRGEFTVNIALVVGDTPVLGAVHIPVAGETYWVARSDGEPRAKARLVGGVARSIAARRPPPGQMVAIASRSNRDRQTEAFLAELGVTETIAAGSSLKFCRLAEGVADVYPRFGPTCEWDTAAGHAVLNAAGGRVTTIDGAPFTYGKPAYGNPGFIAWGLSPPA